ncbi:hypothetical protein SAMN06272755_0643 [Picosynechococcus sp. OG1]|nr:hypothetical protein SAMN06272755_0643 [Picosynechococcus sp. OG1]SMQ84741.1 hypothetical protein SAMN06272774_3017 [Synechococcus sp. 7002]
MPVGLNGAFSHTVKNGHIHKGKQRLNVADMDDRSLNIPVKS